MLRIKKKIGEWIRRNEFKIIFVLAIFVGGYILGMVFNPKTISHTNLVAIQEPYQVKEVLINYMLSRLEQCESSGRENIVILDSNNAYSYGSLQYQTRTFLEFGKKYDIIAQDIDNAEPLILDRDLQMAIAYQMLSNEKNAWQHWYNCSKKIGLDKIDFVDGFK